MMKIKLKNKLSLFLAAFFAFLTVVQPIQVEQVQAFDPIKSAMCSLWGEYGKTTYKAMTTKWVQYLTVSKSVSQSMDNPNSVYNSLLKLSGYDIGGNGTTPFERFGMNGLTFTSYLGEWKYFNVNPCETGDRQIPQASNLGEYYEGRLDPISSYEEISSSRDVRTIEYAKGRGNAFWKAFVDNINNMIMSISKMTVSITLSLISFAFSDFSSAVGLTQKTKEGLFLNFYNSFFAPFVTLMFILSGLYIVYQGMIKRNVRGALVSGLLKTSISFFAAMALFTNPSLTELPNKVANLGQTLVVSSLANNPISNENQSLCPISVKDVETDELDFLDKQTKKMTLSIGCRMWSEILFKPFVKAQFGVNYSELDQLDNVNSSWVGTPTVHLGDNSIDNWGLFHVSVMSGYHDPLDGLYTSQVGGVNKDYYRIVDALSNYNEDIVDDVKNNTKLPTQQNTTPLKEWDAWVGNQQGQRTGYNLMTLLFSLVGSLAPAYFAIKSALFSLAISLLMILSPVFLLLGCWGGKGNQTLVKFGGTLLNTMLNKVISSLLLVFSVILITNSFELLNKVGLFESLLFMIITTYLLIKNKSRLISLLGNFNLSQFDPTPAKQVVNNLTKKTKDGAEIVGYGVVGGVASAKNKGGFFNGFKDASKVTFRNKLYRSDLGRKANMVFETINKTQGTKAYDGVRHCVDCGVALTEGTEVYIDINGNYFCDTCASALGYANLSATFIDNKDNEHFKFTRDTSGEYLDDFTGGNRRLTYLTRSEVAKINSDEINIVGETTEFELKRKAIQKRILDSMKITHRDIEALKESGKEAWNAFVPEPIRPYMSKDRANLYLKNKDYKGYEEAMQDAWYKWYKNSGVSYRFDNKPDKNGETIDTDISYMKEEWARILKSTQEPKEKELDKQDGQDIRED